jgi:acyl-CoA thioesterase FadM
MATTNPTRPDPPAWLKLLRSALGLLGFTAAGAAVGFTVARLFDQGGPLPEIELSWGGWFAFVLMALGFWFLVVLIHEAGHLAGGMLAGFKPALLIVGPLRLSWVDGRPQASLNRSLALAGGLASAAPDDDRDLPRRMLLMVIGGPLGSLMVGLLALAALPFAGGLAWLVLFTGAALGFAVTAVTLIPLHAGGFSSDGARIGMLLRGGPLAERWCAMALLVGASMAGRLAETNPAIVARATALRDETVDALGAAYLAYAYHLARGEHAQAGEQLTYALEHQQLFNEGVRPALLIEAAYFTARHRGDAVAARAYLQESKSSSVVEAYTRRRAEAAVLHAEGRVEEARAAAEAGLQALDKARAGAAGATERRLLEDLR